MTDGISPKQFDESEGVEEWRVIGDGACAYFRTKIAYWWSTSFDVHIHRAPEPSVSTAEYADDKVLAAGGGQEA